MTPTISPAAGVLPQSQYAPAATGMHACCRSATPAATAPGVAPETSTSGGGGAVGAVQGVQGLSEEQSQQVVQLLQKLVALVNELVQVLQQRGGVQGMSAAASAPPVSGGGANGGPDAQPARSGGGSGSPGQADDHAHGHVDPSSVKDKTGTGGMNASALRGLEEAHRFGLPLVSGKRSGNGDSDHDHGNAIDVSAIAIGAPESTQHTPEMKAFAEHMRQQGKAGKLDVKYVISEGRIASSRQGWEWRPYVHPDYSEASINALKSSSRGEYNRLQHYDHVHVSFH